MDTFAALANLANLKKLHIENMDFDLTRFDDYAHRLKPVVSLKELRLYLRQFRGDHSFGRKFVDLISAMFPNLARFDLDLTYYDVSMVS